jgi:hypothetical protein
MRSQILLDYAIKPSIRRMGSKYFSNEACLLLLATCAQESEMGKYIKQLGGGPALSIFQTEPLTERDCWTNHINFDPVLKAYMLSLLPDHARGDDVLSIKLREQCLITNLEYAIAIARLIYYRSSTPMPTTYNVKDYWEFYKEVYNTRLGSAKEDEFYNNWNRFIKDVKF